MSLLDTDNWPHLATLTRTVVVNDEFGGHEQTNADSSYASDVPCWVQEASESQVREFQGIDQRVSHTIYFQSDPGMNLYDDILISGDPFDGKRLAPKGFGNCTVGFDILFRVICEEYRQTE